MPSITPNRIRLTLDQKQKIIEDSKKPGFNKAKVLEQYGIKKMEETQSQAKITDSFKINQLILN